jgi:predicted kinase
MKRVTLLRGLPACGKTTWAKEQLKACPGRYKRISKDDLRAMLDNGTWSKHNEQFILKARNSLILAALQDGYHVLIDDTNLHPKHEDAIRELVKGLAAVSIQDFTHVPLEVCLERDRQRPNYVGEQVIRRMYRDFLQPKRLTYLPDPALPRAIICDIDGTLALTAGRNPYDAEHCEQDALNVPVTSILAGRHQAGEQILLVSGRQECHRAPTERWLAAQSISYTALWMRPTGDQRKDVLIKEEIYKEQIEGRYAITFALDDRNQTVAFWRSLGIATFQVADGDF